MSTVSTVVAERVESDAGPSAPQSVVDLYQAHAQFVWRRLQQMGVHTSDLEDALQEVFVVAFRNWANFDPNRAKPRTWLFGIGLNVARNFNRGQRRREAHIDRDAEPHAEPTVLTPEDALCRRQSQGLLEQVLGELPIEHRTTFVLFELEGMSGMEIAEQMAVPEGTVRSRLYHARKHLEAALARHAETERVAGVITP
jgi:RNA polymerase sigma-70 factor (ECF subfamily)